jgi:hypothetical protein
LKAALIPTILMAVVLAVSAARVWLPTGQHRRPARRHDELVADARIGKA